MALEKSNQWGPGRLNNQGNYDVRFIEQVVGEVENGLPRYEAIKKYHLNKWTLGDWMRKSPTRRRRSPSQPAHIKRSVVRSIADGRLTIQEAMNAYGIKYAKTIKEWILWEKQENSDLSSSNYSNLSKTKLDNTPAATSEDAVKALEQQLADAQLKIAALNTLIDVAEEQLKINIRKKPGAKQS